MLVVLPGQLYKGKWVMGIFPLLLEMSHTCKQYLMVIMTQDTT